MKYFFIALLFSTFLICPIHASSLGADSIRKDTACRAGVLAPNQIGPRLLQKTAYEPDAIVGETQSTACCDVVCTRMLSTTRLPMTHEIGRT